LEIELLSASAYNVSPQDAINSQASKLYEEAEAYEKEVDKIIQEFKEIKGFVETASTYRLVNTLQGIAKAIYLETLDKEYPKKLKDMQFRWQPFEKLDQARTSTSTSFALQSVLLRDKQGIRGAEAFGFVATPHSEYSHLC
jgi:hypothetical protein